MNASLNRKRNTTDEFKQPINISVGNLQRVDDCQLVDQLSHFNPTRRLQVRRATLRGQCNAWLIDEGLAWHYDNYSDSSELDEHEARMSRRGQCVDEDPVATWEWRRR
ncbi:MAG: hypothetical protein AAFN77_23010 [Planctomycetota bacterium]